MLRVACLMVMFMSGCLTSPPRNVEYRVTGSASSVAITYENADECGAQVAGRVPPWSYSFTGGHQDQFVYVSAQNEGWSGSVTVSIWFNGKLWRTSTSSGGFVIATASGLLP